MTGPGAKGAVALREQSSHPEPPKLHTKSPEWEKVKLFQGRVPNRYIRRRTPILAPEKSYMFVRGEGVSSSTHTPCRDEKGEF